MTNIQDEPAYSKNVLEFITVAHEYCLTLEAIEKTSLDRLVDVLLKITPLLYVKASLLPAVQVEDFSRNERFVTEEQYQGIFNACRSKLRSKDTFWFIDMENPDENMPIKGSISENLADIYQDLKDFVLLYQKESREAKKVAVWSCKKLFVEHWGYCLLNGLKAMHHIFYFGETEGPDLPDLF